MFGRGCVGVGLCFCCLHNITKLTNTVQEIWTPDIYLWNQQEPLQATMADTYASVTSAGIVFWTRPGRIKATCKFVGLDKFPFDTLTCQLEFGSWVHSGLFLRTTKMGGEGYTIGGSDTAGQSFAEFRLKQVSVNERVYPPFPGALGEDWPVLLYAVEFQRAYEPYVRGFLLLQIMLNLCGFACFWIPPHVGERMGLAITALLAAVASELAVASKLPAASEFNWFAIFSLVSMLFSVAVVFQSAVVIYFHYYTGSNLRPVYVQWTMNKCKERKRNKQKKDASSAQRLSTASQRSDRAADLDKGETEHGDANEGELGSGSFVGGQNSVRRSSQTAHVRNGTRNDSCRTNTTLESATGMDRGGNSVSSLPQEKGSVGSPTSSSPRVSFAEYEVSFAEYEKPVYEHQGSVRFTPSAEDELAKNLANSSANLRHDADDFMDDEAKKNNVRWQIVASLVDEYSRLIFPIAYAIFMGIIFPRAGNSTD